MFYKIQRVGLENYFPLTARPLPTLEFQLWKTNFTLPLSKEISHCEQTNFCDHFFPQFF